MGDLLIHTFQEEKKDLIKAGWHVGMGMAATSVLEPPMAKPMRCSRI